MIEVSLLKNLYQKDQVLYDLDQEIEREEKYNVSVIQANKDNSHSIGQYEKSALGGSFDHLHNGHRVFLTYSCLCSKSIHIGITSDNMISKKDGPEIIQPFSQRKSAILEFYEDLGCKSQVSIEEINDVCGKSGTSTELQNLIITEETKAGAGKVNEVKIPKKD